MRRTGHEDRGAVPMEEFATPDWIDWFNHLGACGQAAFDGVRLWRTTAPDTMPAAFSGTDSRRQVVHAIVPPPRPAVGDHRRCAGRFEARRRNEIGPWSPDRTRCTRTAATVSKVPGPPIRSVRRDNIRHIFAPPGIIADHSGARVDRRRFRPGFIDRRVPDYVTKYKRDLNCY
jgi:hypothetical protein